jgi:hypothetical protein
MASTRGRTGPAGDVREWFIQIPGFVALNVTSHTSPGRASTVFIHNGLPDGGVPFLIRISAGWVQMPGMRLRAPVDHGEPDEIALGDELIRDGRVTPAVDRQRVRRPTVDHDHTTVQNDGAVSVDEAASIERYDGRRSAAQQVELGHVSRGRLGWWVHEGDGRADDSVASSDSRWLCVRRSA